jgi:hypothetical protein
MMFTILSQTSVGGVISIELVQKRSLWGYLGDEFALFMKIVVTQPRIVPRVRDEYLFMWYFPSLIFQSFYVPSRMERSPSETYFQVLLQPLKVISRILCAS